MEKINMYRKKLSKSKEIEVKQDIIVPDSKQDLLKVLDENFYCYFSKVDVQAGRIKVNGDVDLYIAYISSNEETIGLQSTFNFDDVLENNIIAENMKLEYNIKVVKSDIKIINERKVSVSVNLKVDYNVYGIDTIEIYNDFNDIEDVQINSKLIKLNSLIGVNSNVASLKEEIKIDGADIISDILKVDTMISNKEVKISYNKILSKADLTVKIIYLTRDGRIEKVQEKFPVMSFIELENVKEENICSTDYQIRNILLKINNGEDNSITVQMEYEVCCKAFESKEREIVSDLYSLKYDTEISLKDIEVSNDLYTKDEKIVDIDEKIRLENVRKVIDVFGKSKILKNTISNNMSNIEGEIELKIYFESESRLGLNVQTATIPFISKVPAQDEFACSFENMQFDFNNSELLVKGNVCILEDSLQNSKISIVQEVNKKEQVSKNDYSMIVYSVKQNDTLWDVSKKFKVKQENIINSNELTEPYNLKAGEKMYIVR